MDDGRAAASLPAFFLAGKEKAKRAIMVLTAFFLSVVASMTYVVLVRRYQSGFAKVTQIFFDRKLSDTKSGEV
jgi:hypothetical protein